jgi:hypothetical protein
MHDRVKGNLLTLDDTTLFGIVATKEYIQMLLDALKIFCGWSKDLACVV